jgi:hypothetical protein
MTVRVKPSYYAAPFSTSPGAAETGSAPADIESGFVCSAQFVRKRCAIIILISGILLLPCFWHTHIEAGDLGSHIYNAWLVQLIQQGRAPGLSVERIWQNVLFDQMLTGLGHFFTLGLTEKIAVSLTVLVFFWSSFAFVCAVSRAVPWSLLPAVAMLAYGWTFQAGFFNYYLSIGFALLGLSILYVERGWRRGYGLILTPLMLLAHPLGLVWFFGAALYILIAERVAQRFHLILLISVGSLLWFVHKFIWSHFIVAPANRRRIYTINGVDQLVVYGNRYRFFAGVLFLFVIACFLFDLLERREERARRFGLSVALELYIVIEMGVLLLPNFVYLPKYPAPLSMLVNRLSLVSAVLVLALLGMLHRRTWHIVGFGALGFIFFCFLYQDTARINSMESQVERLVSELPPGTRVMATILSPPGAPPYVLGHIVDRACIERCFSFENYEPSSGQFRVRAAPGNRIVTDNAHDVQAMQSGEYFVKPEDLPIFQIYQCPPFSLDLCIRKLGPGERNGRP